MKPLDEIEIARIMRMRVDGFSVSKIAARLRIDKQAVLAVLNVAQPGKLEARRV
jgi:hypothetical protein